MMADHGMATAAASPRIDREVDPSADSGERTYAVFTHLVGLLSLLDAGVLLGLIGTGVMWFVRRGASPYLDDHGREAMNFQISLLILGLLAILLIIPTVGLSLLAVAILRVVGSVRGAMAAHRGEFYRYPMCIRFLG